MKRLSGTLREGWSMQASHGDRDGYGTRRVSDADVGATPAPPEASVGRRDAELSTYFDEKVPVPEVGVVSRAGSMP